MRLLALLAALFVASVGDAQTVNLPARETLSYAVEWRLVTAGKARLDWTALSGGRGWESRFHLESIGLVSKLFKVEDDYFAQLNQGLCAQSSQMSAREGVRQRETRITFDANTRKAAYLEIDKIHNTTVLSQEIDIPPCVHDVFGGLYILRTMRLEPGQSAQLPISDGKKSVSARVEAQARETVKTPSGTYKTIRYEAFLFNNVLYRRPAHLHVWLTDDARKLPVQLRVKMQFTIGTITLQLEKES